MRWPFQMRHANRSTDFSLVFSFDGDVDPLRAQGRRTAPGGAGTPNSGEALKRARAPRGARAPGRAAAPGRGGAIHPNGTAPGRAGAPQRAATPTRGAIDDVNGRSVRIEYGRRRNGRKRGEIAVVQRRPDIDISGS